MTDKSQFEFGHQIPVHHQDRPGFQHKIPDPKPVSDKLPTEDGGYQLYKAAGKLQGKRAVITGGDSGIGRAVAILYAMEGASSLIAYLDSEEKDAQETKKEVEKYGAKCFLFPTDLRKRENCKAVIDKAVEQLGGIDILVNNAAFQKMLPDIKDLSEEQWLNTFNTNIHPYFFLAKYALPHLKRGSTIINCASVNPYVGRGDLLDYTSSKGAIVAFTRALSNQQVGKGIRVNAVCPGPIWTPLIPSTMTTEAMEQFSGVPMGRPGQPSEVATCFVFLASQDSSYMSGQSLHPNGGVVVGS
ncbi:oxidoreductase, short-chain dehydrogenase/reductase family [Talaromyces stipitatus ATCC 10500]|uniref:Oxidoreductase, short-chain dehydrogenase/reductase family n=1 Tax=Talaromyces stipitatus (strain ATCC 10500 / CBS 375.48 / QM 6759 / NRRL 1006) TaxID=441959 RepID=B8LTP1_TALSN|nr:oxidoreductase, short-chain dehydrogenase/reductase family [Talaromyces stipitatus ATCC 10500]XP_002341022.1 oxidoreductase, short-chain dehydrogenase/reductase family [Talaromyces stipitatus ATCC 10500]EED23633.1 oxidoreductase, short-chain dehydrogenase/reductase family [Talaromyces stipitatus ATCC 10500]EED23635.1 oxidoreductase, short-chain dehydrogenase/reductase family [Talaromyces stipitatus ATCC 10500]